MHQLPHSLLYLSPYVKNDSLFNADDNFKLARTPFRSFPPYINNDSLFFGFSKQMITSKLQEPSRLEIYQHSRKQKMSSVVQLNVQEITFLRLEICWLLLGLSTLLGVRLRELNGTAITSSDNFSGHAKACFNFNTLEHVVQMNSVIFMQLCFCEGLILRY